MDLIKVFETEADYRRLQPTDRAETCIPANMIVGLWKKHFSVGTSIHISLDESWGNPHFLAETSVAKKNFVILKGSNAALAEVMTFIGNDTKKVHDLDIEQVGYAFTRWLGDASIDAAPENKEKLKDFVKNLQDTLCAQPQPEMRL